MNNFNQEQERLLENALNNLPLAPLPSGFTNRVMAAVQTGSRQAVPNGSSTPIRFRLQFLDIALALFWSLALAVIWLFVLWWAGLLQLPGLSPVLPIFPIIEQLSRINPTMLLGGAIIILLEMSLLGLVGLNVLGERPFSS